MLMSEELMKDQSYRDVLRMDASLYAIFRKILGELNLQVVEHGDRVAYLYLKLGQYRKLKHDDHFRDMMIACYAHDIGAYKTEKFLDLLKFDVSNTQEHCIYGYLFMKHFSPLGENAEVLLYHHTYYSDRENYKSKYLSDGILMHMLDRIDIFNIKHEDLSDVLWQVKNGAGRNFDPQDVADFIEADKKYHMLESLRDGIYKAYVKDYFDTPEICEDLIMPMINMLSYEVDFKSEQTVVHTITTQLLARAIGRLFHLSDRELKELELAAGLHDLGKIKIPSQIVEKPGRLTPEEYDHMKKHVAYTNLIVGDIFPRKIVLIASNHHERLDGSGYPRGITGDGLTMQDRILQIADVTSALMQKRSYKCAMDKELVIRILKEDADAGKLDSLIVAALIENYDEIESFVWKNSIDTITRYENMKTDYARYLKEFSSSEQDSMEEFNLLPGREPG